MAIEIVDFPIKHGDFSIAMLVYQRVPYFAIFHPRPGTEVQGQVGIFHTAAAPLAAGQETCFSPAKSMGFTLWLCQNSYWKWPLIVDLPTKTGDFP